MRQVLVLVLLLQVRPAAEPESSDNGEGGRTGDRAAVAGTDCEQGEQSSVIRGGLPCARACA
jgi:hypothetical protein